MSKGASLVNVGLSGEGSAKLASPNTAAAAAGTYAGIFVCLLAFAGVFTAVVAGRTYPVAPADGLVYADAFDQIGRAHV